MKNYNLLIQGEQEAHDGSLRSFGTKTYDKKRSYLFRILSRRAILTILHSPPFSFSGRVLRKRRALSAAKGEGKEYNAGIFQIDYGYAFRCKGIFGKLRVTRSDEVFQSYTKDQKNKRDSPRIGSARDQATNKYKLSGGVVIFVWNMTRSEYGFIVYIRFDEAASCHFGRRIKKCNKFVLARALAPALVPAVLLPWS